MKKIIFFLFISFFVYVSAPVKVEAAKKFVPKTATRTSGGGDGSLPSVVRYRGDKLGLLLSFSNFNGLESVAYSFTYNTNAIPEGVGGTVTGNNNPLSVRELLFGTCSKGVCTYHYNLTNARLVLNGKLTNGRTVSKSYRVKTYN